MATPAYGCPVCMCPPCRCPDDEIIIAGLRARVKELEMSLKAAMNAEIGKLTTPAEREVARWNPRHVGGIGWVNQ